MSFDFDVIPSQTLAALNQRRDDLGLTHVTDADVLRLAHDFWEQAQGGSLVMSFAQALSMDLHIPEATIEATLAVVTLDEEPVEDRLLCMIEDHRSLTGLRRLRAERQARRDIARAAATRHRIYRRSA
jgi:hypothetical protein